MRISRSDRDKAYGRKVGISDEKPGRFEDDVFDGVVVVLGAMSGGGGRRGGGPGEVVPEHFDEAGADFITAGGPLAGVGEAVDELVVAAGDDSLEVGLEGFELGVLAGLGRGRGLSLGGRGEGEGNREQEQGLGLRRHGQCSQTRRA